MIPNCIVLTFNKAQVKTSRNPGSNVNQQQVNSPLHRVYTTPARNVYPVRNIVDTNHVLAIAPDQNVNTQNLDVQLAEAQAPISSTSNSGNSAFSRVNANFRRRISTTVSPREIESLQEFIVPNNNKLISPDQRRQGHKHLDSINVASQSSYRVHESKPLKPAVSDYDYYEDDEVSQYVTSSDGEIAITSQGYIKCLDQGTFAHPNNCRKFISCAKIVNGVTIGTEYSCPSGLSFDPVGGMCNWAAGLGCD
uniref:Chitin-binding type-2 domain-containing protein n=1 Tax=Trichogramma kaykai TaxID=54128 RepID=A0ABD2XDY3_9HYME